MEIEEQDNIINLITKYLEGTANAEEEADLKNWILASESNKQYFNQIKNIWEISGKRFDPELIKTDKALDKVLKRITKGNQIKTIWLNWRKIASVILILLMLGNIIFFIHILRERSSLSQPIYSEVYATFGTRTALKLSDGSLVWLNSGSSFKYPDKFIGKERVVYLNGEAYFEVASNELIPFKVQTASIIVNATGTIFNVSDYNSDLNSNVTLVEGEVMVRDVADYGQNKQASKLYPNQHLIFNKKNGIISVNNEDISEYIAWKDGKLIFRNKPLSYVVDKISQMFNVDIELQGSELQDYHYRATFQDESLSEILRLLKISSPIDYMEVKRSPLPDGTFPRKKVIIFPVKEGSK